ncbi:hypothetical protein V8E51_011423 [Hyaloscypha variabilis]
MKFNLIMQTLTTFYFWFPSSCETRHSHPLTRIRKQYWEGSIFHAYHCTAFEWLQMDHTDERSFGSAATQEIVQMRCSGMFFMD